MFKLFKRREKEYIYDTCEDCEWECEKWVRHKGGYEAGNMTAGKMGPLPESFTEKHANPSLYGQKSPKGTVRPPLITTRQETPPGPIHICCRECCRGD